MPWHRALAIAFVVLAGLATWQFIMFSKPDKTATKPSVRSAGTPSINAPTEAASAPATIATAAPWLLIARAAQKRKDTAAFQEDLQRASRAEFFDRRANATGDMLASIGSNPEPVQTMVIEQMIAADSRDDPGEYAFNFTMFRMYCEKQGEAERREVCGNLKRVLSDSRSDLLGRTLGRDMKPLGGVPGASPPIPSPFAQESFRGNYTCKGAAQATAWLLRKMR